MYPLFPDAGSLRLMGLTPRFVFGKTEIRIGISVRFSLSVQSKFPMVQYAQRIKETSNLNIRDDATNSRLESS